MNQTSSSPRSLPVSMRWLSAGSDPVRSAHGLQCAKGPFAHSQSALRRPPYPRGVARASIRRSHPRCVTFTAELSARIKSP